MFNKKIIYALAISLPLLSSCQDEDFGFTKQEIRESVFTRDFISAFGPVAEDQDWIGFDGGRVTVFCDQDARISIYTTGLKESILVREAYLPEGETMTIGYDVPAGVNEVNVVCHTRNGKVKSEFVSVKMHKVVNFSSAGTRASVIDGFSLNSTEWLMTMYMTEIVPINLGTSLPGYSNFYSPWKWPLTGSTVSSEEVENPNMTLPMPEVIDILNRTYSTIEYSDLTDCSVGSFSFNPTPDENEPDEIGDEAMVMLFVSHVKPNMPSVSIGYYILYGEDSMSAQEKKDAVKNARKYILVPNCNTLEVGQTFFLPYYSESDITPHDGYGEWPAETVKVHFFISEYVDDDGNAIATTQNVGGNHSMMANKLYFSDSEFNEDGKSPMKAFNNQGMQFISFEDYLDGESGLDFKDVIFNIEGTTIHGVDVKNLDSQLEYTIACEDLGGSFDFDYNDIVFKINWPFTVAGCFDCIHGDVEITPLAAGGWMNSTIWYDVNQNGSYDSGDYIIVDEVHAAFGVDPGIPVNVHSTKKDNIVDGAENKVAQTVSVPYAQLGWNTSTILSEKLKYFHITCYNPLNDSDNGLWWADDNRTDVGTSTNDGTPISDKEFNVLGVPAQKGSVPFVFVIPTTNKTPWIWPNENVFIEKVYPGFKNWAMNRQAGTHWYDAENWWDNDENPAVNPEQTSKK